MEGKGVLQCPRLMGRPIKQAVTPSEIARVKEAEQLVRVGTHVHSAMQREKCKLYIRNVTVTRDIVVCKVLS